MIALLPALFVITHHAACAFTPPSIASSSSSRQRQHQSWALGVSELHIPGYRETKQHFLNGDYSDEISITSADYSSLLPYQDGYLIHKTNGYLFTPDECDSIVREAEEVAAKMGWTTTRHGVSLLLQP